MSGNDKVFEFASPCFSFRIFISYPPYLRFAGSFPAGKNNAGHFNFETSSASTPPNKASTTIEGWKPTIETIP